MSCCAEIGVLLERIKSRVAISTVCAVRISHGHDVRSVLIAFGLLQELFEPILDCLFTTSCNDRTYILGGSIEDGVALWIATDDVMLGRAVALHVSHWHARTWET